MHAIKTDKARADRMWLRCTLPSCVVSLAIMLSVSLVLANPAQDCIQTQDVQLAIRGCTEVVRLAQGDMRLTALRLRGIAYLRARNFDGAIADFNTVLSAKPDIAEVRGSRGLAYALKGQYDYALADLDETARLRPDLADRLRPDFAVTYAARGAASLDKGQYDEAINDLGEAARLKPDLADRLQPAFSEAYYRRGVAFRKKNDLARAHADLN